MANLKAGDAVRIADREATAQDAKTGLFYGHYRGLPGTVQKVYKGDEVAVELELDSLPEDVWKRHMHVRDQMREKWLASLADDVRRKLTPEQKQFDLRYTVLVSPKDLERRRVTKPRQVE